MSCEADFKVSYFMSFFFVIFCLVGVFESLVAFKNNIKTVFCHDEVWKQKWLVLC